MCVQATRPLPAQLLRLHCVHAPHTHHTHTHTHTALTNLCLHTQLLKALNHPNIVRSVECFTSQNKLCIVMEWCSEGETALWVMRTRVCARACVCACVCVCVCARARARAWGGDAPGLAVHRCSEGGCC